MDQSADTNSDNNPMLRDGLTGDWYAYSAKATNDCLQPLGSELSLATKAPATRRDSRPMRIPLRLPLPTSLRKNVLETGRDILTAT